MRTILHTIITSVVFVLLWRIFEAITISSIILGIVIQYFIDSTVDPEKGVTNYGMYMSHSQILWIFVFIFNPIHLIALTILGVSLHDILDISPSTPEVKKTTYNLWLLINALIGFSIFLIFLLL